MIKQKGLPYMYEAEKKPSAEVTSLGGLPIYLDLAYVSGLRRSIEKHLRIKRNGQGWTDARIVMALILLNLAGGNHVEDLRILESDKGFCRVVEKVEQSAYRASVSQGAEADSAVAFSGI